ncbi:hypothetical protein WDZ92_00095 [Nostoc sp. NIES-2111]
MPKLFFWGLLVASMAQAQTRVNLSRQGRVVDFSGFSATKPAAVGSTLPQTCALGEVFLLLFGAQGGNLHVCTQANVWTAQSGLPPVPGQTGKLLATDGIGAQWVAVGGDVSGVLSNLQVGGIRGRAVSNVAPLDGQALIWNQSGAQWEAQSLSTVTGNTVTVKAGGTVAGSSGVLRFNAGPGLSLAITDLGTEVGIEPSVDSAVVQTRAAAQSGESLLCSGSGGTGMVFACSLNPVLVSYTMGMQLLWLPQRDATGGPVTLNVDTLGAKAVKLADGVSDPSAGDFLVGHAYPLWYDGTAFRMLATSRLQDNAPCVSSGGTGMAFSCALNPALRAYSTGMLILWRPDRNVDGSTVTLNVNALGDRPVKLLDGVSDPTTADVRANELYPLWYDGTVFRTLVVSRRQENSACVSSGGTDMAFTCSLNPVLQAYADGMMVLWRTDRDSDGTGVTLNINGLGALPVKLPDGVADPGVGDVRAGQLYPLWYDGTVFRLVVASRRSYETQALRPVCNASERGRQWFVPGGTGVKDSLSVCAKDASDAYNWRLLY